MAQRSEKTNMNEVDIYKLPDADLYRVYVELCLQASVNQKMLDNVVDEILMRRQEKANITTGSFVSPV